MTLHTDAEVFVAGIDPGRRGGLCVLDVHRRRIVDHVELSYAVTNPEAHVPVLDAAPLLSKLDDYAFDQWAMLEEHKGKWKQKHLYVVVERQQFMAQDNHRLRNAYMTAFNYGVLCQALRSAQFVVEMSLFPAGNIWKKAMGLTSNKELSRKIATDLFPDDAARIWPRKKDDGLAEAALLAWYGAKFFGLLRGKEAVL